VDGKGIIECRICQEEGEEAAMDSPCACAGTLKVRSPLFLSLSPYFPISLWKFFFCLDAWVEVSQSVVVGQFGVEWWLFGSWAGFKMQFLCFWSSACPFFWSLRFGNFPLVMSMFMFSLLLPSFLWLSRCSSLWTSHISNSYRLGTVAAWKFYVVFAVSSFYQVKRCQTDSVSSSVHLTSVFARCSASFGFV
jgi:hypothetical protein